MTNTEVYVELKSEKESLYYASPYFEDKYCSDKGKTEENTSAITATYPSPTHGLEQGQSTDTSNDQPVEPVAGTSADSDRKKGPKKPTLAVEIPADTPVDGNNNDTKYMCGICGKEEVEGKGKFMQWVECEVKDCEKWEHFICQGYYVHARNVKHFKTIKFYCKEHRKMKN